MKFYGEVFPPPDADSFCDTHPHADLARRIFADLEKPEYPKIDVEAPGDTANRAAWKLKK